MSENLGTLQYLMPPQQNCHMAVSLELFALLLIMGFFKNTLKCKFNFYSALTQMNLLDLQLKGTGSFFVLLLL